MALENIHLCLHHPAVFKYSCVSSLASIFVIYHSLPVAWKDARQDHSVFLLIRVKGVNKVDAVFLKKEYMNKTQILLDKSSAWTDLKIEVKSSQSKQVQFRKSGRFVLVFNTHSRFRGKCESKEPRQS